MLTSLSKKIKSILIVLVAIFLFAGSIATPAVQAQPFGAEQTVRAGWAAGTLIGNFILATKDGTGTSLQKFVSNTIIYMLDVSLLAIVGCDKQANPDCSGVFSKGALGATTDMVAALYIPQASGVEYVASTLQEFGLVESAHAQTGTGFNAMAPLLPMWRAFRNFTYISFVIIFIVLGFAVMFRWKLNPQTVITIQSALPRIVVALLLVTFSYAIAGLLIDLLYVFISLGALLFGSIPGANANLLQTQFTQDGGFWNLAATLGGQAGLANILNTGRDAGIAGAIIGGVAGFFGGGGVGALTGAAGGAAVGMVLVLLIFAIIILYVLVRLFIQLLQSYIAIIFLIVFGPLQIAFGVIPGMPGFSSWIKSLAGNLAVFGGVAMVLMLGLVINHHINTAALWRAPLLVGSGYVADHLNVIIGIGILLVVHQVPQAIRNAFGLRGLGFAPGEAYRAGATPVNIYSGYMQGEAERFARLYPGMAGAGAGHRTLAGIARFLSGR